MNKLRVHDLSTRHIGPISLTLEGPSVTAIQGPSGSGKSLLMRAIADLDVHEGEVTLNDKSCSSMPAHIWRRYVTYLPTESAWWEETVGAHFAQESSITEQLTRLNLTGEILGRSVAHCSSGEKQRLALLRALQHKPTVLLLDEPTSSLDSDSAASAEQMIAAYAKKHDAIVLWISHDPKQVARVADGVYALNKGKLEQVPHD